MLGPAERAMVLSTATNERQRTHKLWGRIAAKEAARRIWHAAGKPPVYPADLASSTATRTADRALFPRALTDSAVAAVSIAHCDGVAVAIAASDPDRRDWESTSRPSPSGPRDSNRRLSPGRAAPLGQVVRGQPPRVDHAVLVRQGSRRQGNRLGRLRRPTRLRDHPGRRILRHDCMSKLGPAVIRAHPARMIDSVRVASARRGDYAWAWTLLEGADS